MRTRIKLAIMAGLIAVAAAVIAVIVTGSHNESVQTKAAREAVYLDAVHARYPDADDAKLLEGGYLICDLYDDGKALSEVEASLISSDMEPEQAGYFATTALVLCPENA